MPCRKSPARRSGDSMRQKFGLAVACLRIGAFEKVPNNARALSTWLSPADAVRAFQAAMTCEPLGFETLFAYSDNDDVWVDLAGVHPVAPAPVLNVGRGMKAQPIQAPTSRPST